MNHSSVLKMISWILILIILIPVASANPTDQPPTEKHMNRDVETATAITLVLCAYPMVVFFPVTSPLFSLGTLLAVSSIYLIYDSTT